MQPPLISFENPTQLAGALATYSPLTAQERSNFEELVARKLPPVISAAALGAVLGINPKLLTAMAKFPYRYYREFKLKRKSGGFRTVSAPRTFLKAVQQYILAYILDPLEIPIHVTGFVKGRGTVRNASVHKGALYVLNVDLHDFFGSVTEKGVREFFLRLGYQGDMARLLMHLCTYNGALPQGAPTSPALANHIFSPIDDEILRLCRDRSLAYSRYADDLTFSGSQPIAKEFLAKLRTVLRKNGFKLNPKKTRFARPGQARYVTGFVVNERVQAPRTLRRTLRAMFHNAGAQPQEHVEAASQLLGWASFVNSYDQQLGRAYLEIARRVARLAGEDGRPNISR